MRQNLPKAWRKLSEIVEEVQALERRADVLGQLKPCITLPVECRTAAQEAELRAKIEELIKLDKDIQAAEVRRRAIRNDIDQLEMMDACPCPPEPRTGLYIQTPPAGATPAPAPKEAPPPKGKGKGNGSGGGQPRSGVLSGNVLQGVGVEVCPPPRTGKEDEPDD